MNWQNLYLLFVYFFDILICYYCVFIVNRPSRLFSRLYNDCRISSNCDLYEFFNAINSFVFVTKYEGETSKENIFNSCNFSFKAGTHQSEMKITDNNHPFIYKRSDCSC